MSASVDELLRNSATHFAPFPHGVGEGLGMGARA